MAVGGGELGAGVVPVVSARRLCWLLGLAGRGGGGGGAARAEGGGQPRVQTAHAQGGLGHHAAAQIWSASLTIDSEINRVDDVMGSWWFGHLK